MPARSSSRVTGKKSWWFDSAFARSFEAQMATIEEIKEAIAALPQSEQQRLRDWFVERDSESWDRKIEDDAASGRLDALADAALRDHETGRSTKL